MGGFEHIIGAAPLNISFNLDTRVRLLGFKLHCRSRRLVHGSEDHSRWNVACNYGDKIGLSTEEYLKRQPMRYEQILPGKPKEGGYKLISARPYKLQQQCASCFRVGRFILVADTAHLCNPL